VSAEIWGAVGIHALFGAVTNSSAWTEMMVKKNNIRIA
jgi:hypothetical protein